MSDPAARVGLVPEMAHGQRLDKALAAVFPDLAELGLRARRRLCERGAVLLHQRIAGPATKVRANDSVELLAEVRPHEVVCAEKDEAQCPCVVLNDGHFTALYKPRGLHSAFVAASATPSLEALLPALLAALDEQSEPQSEASSPSPFPRLLNRLDHETSGLVLVARTESGFRRWGAAESEGRIDKRYLAIIEGTLTCAVSIDTTLDTTDRKVTRIRTTSNPDPLRHTDITPLGMLPSGPLFPDAAIPLTLVGCRIRKGARHQIRAHLASIGHPLAGDSLYGATLCAPYRLHHAFVALPGFSAHLPPDWLNMLSEELVQSARFFLALKI